MPSCIQYGGCRTEGIFFFYNRTERKTVRQSGGGKERNDVPANAQSLNSTRLFARRSPATALSNYKQAHKAIENRGDSYVKFLFTIRAPHGYQLCNIGAPTAGIVRHDMRLTRIPPIYKNIPTERG